MPAQIELLLKRSTFAQRAQQRGWKRAALEQLLDLAEGYLNTRTPLDANSPGALHAPGRRVVGDRVSDEP